MKIGLTHTGNPEKHQFYLDWLKANDAIEIVSLSAAENNLQELKNCDALILSGGVDIHPSFYGNPVTDYTGAPEKFNVKRDEYEIAAFHMAQDNALPVLGICRGMQLINVIHGGTMKQHLGTDHLVDKHIGNPDKSHPVTIQDGTLLYDIIGTAYTRVNSAHHQSVDKLGTGLQVNALSEEGIIEGVERSDSTGKPFLLAVQWHPERMFRFDLANTPAAKEIRKRFIEEIKKSKKSKHENY